MSDMPFTLMSGVQSSAKIKVIGVGGGGGNAVEHMHHAKVKGVDFICANTDAQALEHSPVETTFQLGSSITRGLGAGANADVGRASAEEDKDRIKDLLNGTDMLFITAGMGGGTGTGAAPVVAEIARDLGILTVAVVTKPFMFEAKKRMKTANNGIEQLKQNVDSLITIPNDKLLEVLPDDISMEGAFAEANNVLLGAVQGISEVITKPGRINVDFADVTAVMSMRGIAMMGTATAKGENRAVKAAEKALRSPLLEDVDLQGAKGILVNITASDNLTLMEFNEASSVITEMADENAEVIVGTVVEPEMQDEIRVTVVATGLCGFAQEEALAAPAAQPEAIEPKQEDVQVPYSQGNVAVDAQPMVSDAQPMDDSQRDYRELDVPSFLRRQAD